MVGIPNDSHKQATATMTALLFCLCLAALTSRGGTTKSQGPSRKETEAGAVVRLTAENFADYVDLPTPSVVTLVVDPSSEYTGDLVAKMRRLSRSYANTLNFFLVAAGDFVEYEDLFSMTGQPHPTVKIVTSLRGGPEHTFSRYSEMSQDKLREWVDSYLSGTLLKARPSIDELENCYSLQIDSKEHALQLNDLAVDYQALGNMELAVQKLEMAISLHPRSPLLHFNMGQAREMMGEMEGAIAEYKLALDNDIRYMDAYHSLARAISVLGDAESAVNILQLATKMQPHDGSMYNSLGVALRANQSYGKALESFNLALSLNHTLDEALLNIGSIWMDLGKFERAVVFFIRALEANEQNFAALTNLVYCNQKMYNWQDFDHLIALLIEAHEVYDQMLHPFHAAAYPLSSEKFKDLAATYAFNTLALVHQKFRFNHRDVNETSMSSRIRLGYISSDLRNNPARDLLLNTMKLRNQNDFEVFFLALDRDNDFVDEYVDTFVDLSMTPYRKVAVVIKELAIDILVNSMVPTDPWFRVAGLNPSFCQVSLAGGYPGTTGTKLVNYVISDRVVSPPELQNLYVEKVAFTPFAIQPLVEELPTLQGRSLGAAATRKSLGIDDHTFVFSYFNTPPQAAMYPSGSLPNTFSLWCSILARSADSVMLIFGMEADAAAAQNIFREAAVHGLRPGRFIFARADQPWATPNSRDVPLVNLLLDNPGVSSQLHGSTFCRTGTPLLTLPSQSPFTRAGASMAVMQGRAMSGVVSSFKDFEDSATYYASARGRPALGRDRDQLLSVHERSRAFNVGQWVLDIEAAYRRLHRRMVRKRLQSSRGNKN